MPLPAFVVWAGYAAGAALIGAIWGGCNDETKAEEKPNCDYNDPKNICTLTFKPAGSTQVEINQAGKIDQFVATEANFTPTKLYSNLCSQWRPGIDLYTLPSKPYPKTADELELSPESGINFIREIEGSTEPFVRCVNDGIGNDGENLTGESYGRSLGSLESRRNLSLWRRTSSNSKWIKGSFPYSSIG